MKKFIAALLACTMVFTYVPYSAFAEDYLTRGEACDIILRAADDYNADVEKSDVMHGDGAGNLDEDREVTKLEAFIMMNRAFGDYPEIKGANKIVNISGAEYDDIPDWAQSDMEQSLAAGIADSVDGTSFGSDEKVTADDLAKYLRRVYAVFGTNLKDDYNYAIHKDYLDSLTVLPGYLGAGPYHDLSEENKKQLQEIVRECVNGSYEEGTKESKIKNYYNNCMDTDARNAMTFDFVSEYIKDAENMETMEDFQALNEKLYNDISVSFIDFGYTIDDMDSDSYAACLGYPDADVSKAACTGQNDVEKNAYIEYVKKELVLYGESEEQAQADAEQYFETQKKIGEKALDTADFSDIENTYNIYTVEQLDEIFGEIDLTKLYADSPFGHLDKIIIWQIDEMEESAKLLTVERMDDLKNYCKIGIILYAASFMGEEYIDAYNQYACEIYGIDEIEPLEERVINNIKTVFSEYISEMYADKYCTDEIKKGVTEMTEQLIDVYRERIDSLTWMSDETKAKAKRKLDTMSVNIGGPDEYNDYYADADIKSAEDGGSYFQNTVEINKQIVKAAGEISKEKVDKTEWPILAHEVNAYYDQYSNGIYIPIAYLLEPLYSTDYSYERNLGATGTTIGHELSHAFDSYGAQYDEYGNVVNWWTDEDAAEFERLCGEIIDYYDKFEWAPGIPVDGELTVTENIADLGGLSVALSLAEKTENFNYDEFFEAYAVANTGVYTRETSLDFSLGDPHSPDCVRVNAVVQQEEKFYETYGIEEGDGMYVAEEDRIGIW